MRGSFLLQLKFFSNLLLGRTCSEIVTTDYQNLIVNNNNNLESPIKIVTNIFCADFLYYFTRLIIKLFVIVSVFLLVTSGGLSELLQSNIFIVNTFLLLAFPIYFCKMFNNNNSTTIFHKVKSFSRLCIIAQFILILFYHLICYKVFSPVPNIALFRIVFIATISLNILVFLIQFFISNTSAKDFIFNFTLNLLSALILLHTSVFLHLLSDPVAYNMLFIKNLAIFTEGIVVYSILKIYYTSFFKKSPLLNFYTLNNSKSL